MDIGGDDHAPAGNLIADGLRGQALTFGYILHLLGGTPLAGVMYLRADFVVRTLRYPLVSHNAIIITGYAGVER